MQSKTIFLLLCLLFLVQMCTDNTGPDDQDESNLVLSEIEKSITIKSNNFGLNLFRETVRNTGNTNIIISPLSISMALGMTMNGSNGLTTDAMRTTLCFGNLSLNEINQAYRNIIDVFQSIDHSVVFQIANSIWCRNGFAVEDSFIYINETYFDALVQNLDFSQSDAANTINSWVSENTKSKIDQIVDSPIDPETVMFLINAIYFNGSWTYKFNPDLTETSSFTTEEGSLLDCRFMNYKCEHPFYINEQFMAIDLPYGEGNYRMLVVLPINNVNIDEFITTIEESTWNSWLDNLEMTEINLYLPKFKIRYENELKEILSTMGMAVTFSPGEADFSKINPVIQLYISKVKHKTYIDVNEEGTEAAAVTSVEIGYTSVGDNDLTPTMRVDHPFIFAIHEIDSGAILFIGKIVKPEYEE